MHRARVPELVGPRLDQVRGEALQRLARHHRGRSLAVYQEICMP
jgi:hypothetical protein